jgi:hypothetical protein
MISLSGQVEGIQLMKLGRALFPWQGSLLGWNVAAYGSHSKDHRPAETLILRCHLENSTGAAFMHRSGRVYPPTVTLQTSIHEMRRTWVQQCLND